MRQRITLICDVVRTERAPRFAAPALALLPMVLAFTGASIDQRSRLGITLWRNACRSAGLTFTSLASFTLQLLPWAVTGALLGGGLVLWVGISRRHSASMAHAALAAHAGCLLGMVGGMLLCAAFLPQWLMLIVEPLLACGAAAWWWRHSDRPRSRASVEPRTWKRPSA